MLEGGSKSERNPLEKVNFDEELEESRDKSQLNGGLAAFKRIALEPLLCLAFLLY